MAGLLVSRDRCEFGYLFPFLPSPYGRGKGEGKSASRSLTSILSQRERKKTRFNSTESFPSPAPRHRDKAQKDRATLLPHPGPTALFLPSRTLPETAETYRYALHPLASGRRSSACRARRSPCL